MSTLWQACRRPWRKPLLPVATVLSVALAVASTTTLFGVASAILLRPLPVRDPARLFTVDTLPRGHLQGRWLLEYDHYRALAERVDRRLVEGLVAYAPIPLFVSGEGHARSVIGEVVSPNYFHVLGVPAVNGRTDIEPGDIDGMPTVLISERLWKAGLGRDRNAEGQTLTLNGRPFRIGGVVGNDFHGLSSPSVFPADVWMGPSAWPALLEGWRLMVHLRGRASAGVTVQAIAAMLQSAVAETLASGQYGRDPRVIAAWGGKSRTNPALDRLVALAGGAATLGGLCLLAIACTNVGLAFAALMHERRSERAVRSALGAGRGRLMLEGIAELGSLAILGGLAGLMLASVGLTMVGRLQPQIIPGVSATIAPSLDWRVAAFGLGLTILAAALCSLVGLRLLGRGRPKWFGDVLTISHVTATVVLLSVAFHLDRTLLAELSKGVGFDQDRLAFARLQIVPRSPAVTPDLAPALQRLSELPAVASVTTVNTIPFAGDAERPCAPVEVDGRSGLSGCHVQVGPMYFETLGLRLLRGKGLQAGPDADAAVVGAAAARIWWPGADPVGRTFVFDHRRLTVIGVAADANHGFPAGIEQPFIYVTDPPSSRRAVTYVVVRSQTSGQQIVSPINQVLRETLSTGVTVTQLSTLSSFVKNGPQFVARVSAMVSTALAVVALLISMLGLYGLVARLVAARRTELAVRAALGAGIRRLLVISLGRAMTMAAAGVAGGTAISFAAFGLTARFLRTPIDASPTTLVAVAVAVLTVAAGACFVASRGARTTDLAATLREL